MQVSHSGSLLCSFSPAATFRYLLITCLSAVNCLAGETGCMSNLQQALANFNRLHSFRGVIQISQFDGSNKLLLHENHHWTLSGENQKVVRERFLAEQKKQFTTYSRYRGVITTFLTGDFVKEGGRPSGKIGVEKWPIPVGAFISPHSFLGNIEGQSLQEIVSESREEAEERPAGQCVLWLNSNESPISYQVNMGPDNRLESIRSYVVPADDLSEKYRESTGNDPKDLWIPRAKLELGNYIELSGMDFPLSATKTWYEVNQEFREGVTQKMEASKSLDPLDPLPEPDQVIVRGVQVATFDPETLEINPHVVDAEFEIDFPPGTTIMDHLENRNYRLESLTEDVLDEINQSLR
ncbi:MAG: hypothetical protein H6752_20860 [Candidatus Omnitrophica bacterium]|nr:hypothetical protein [Candidatus Omnitrophota bacterium]MCB9770659.1 hypothetical protein [Candidatus Omnitrophota bacterium]